MKEAQKLHPFVHIFLCLLLSSVVFALSSHLKLFALCLFAFVYASLRLEQGLKGALRTLWHSLPLLLSVFLVQLIFRRQGELLWHWGFLAVYSTGFSLAAQLFFRLLCVIYAAKVLATLSFQEFSLAFALLSLPEELGFMLSYAVHLVPEFIKELKGFVTKLKLRGIQTSKLPFGQRLQVFKLLAVASLAGIIGKSESAAIALELRGFRSNGKRSYLHYRKLSLADLIYTLPLLSLILLIALA